MDSFDIHDFIKPEPRPKPEHPPHDHLSEKFWDDALRTANGMAHTGVNMLSIVNASQARPIPNLTRQDVFLRNIVAFGALQSSEYLLDGLLFEGKNGVKETLTTGLTDFVAVPAIILKGPGPLSLRVAMGIGAHLLGRVASPYLTPPDLSWRGSMFSEEPKSE